MANESISSNNQRIETQQPISQNFFDSFGSTVKNTESSRNNLRFEDRKNTQNDKSEKLTMYNDYSSTQSYIHRYVPIRATWVHSSDTYSYSRAENDSQAEESSTQKKTREGASSIRERYMA